MSRHPHYAQVLPSFVSFPLFTFVSVKIVEDFEAAKGNDVMKELILSFDG